MLPLPAISPLSLEHKPEHQFGFLMTAADAEVGRVSWGFLKNICSGQYAWLTELRMVYTKSKIESMKQKECYWFTSCWILSSETTPPWLWGYWVIRCCLKDFFPMKLPLLTMKTWYWAWIQHSRSLSDDMSGKVINAINAICDDSSKQFSCGFKVG